jgi:hypothetical protein
MFSIIPEHTDAFVLSLHEFQNSVAVQIGLLLSQLFTNNHFHLFFIMEPATSQMLLQRPKQVEFRWTKVRTIELYHYRIVGL